MDFTLVVLAAGMGSRFGGLKQMEGVGPSGETLLDYSVFDAVRAGFNRVVFIIRRDFEAEFRSRIVSKYEKHVDVALAFQQVDDLPGGRVCRVERQKPWGTGHAIWSARHAVNSPFLVVNADDFYGAEAYATMAKKLSAYSGHSQISLVAYLLGNTLSENGSVSRGVCTVAAGGVLEKVEEHSQIARHPDGGITGLDSAGVLRQLKDDTLVSMNFWGFTPEIFSLIERHFAKFLDASGIENPRSEFYIPGAVSSIISEGHDPAVTLITHSQWYGMTYREDEPMVASALTELVRKGEYPSPLV